MLRNAMDRFWQWFQEHLDKINLLSSTDAILWDATLEQLQRVDGRLWFEVSNPSDGIREFVVTAQGEKGAFPLVDELVAKAPAIPGWRIVALKPSMGFDFVTTYEGIAFDPAEMWFFPLRSKSFPQALGVRVGVPLLTPELRRQADNAVLVILDTALGERSAAIDIQHVESCDLPEMPAEKGFMRLHELPDYIRWHKENRRAI